MPGTAAKLHQLKATIQQLELSGGGRNVEMRREFNGLLAQFQAKQTQQAAPTPSAPTPSHAT
tara:strand:+ start:172 stop:357 length:186 start_codon:yes stop_codon:yes gene_type:complete